MSKELFLENAKEYFKENYEVFVKKMHEPQTHGFFINEKKGNNDDILSLVDFEYERFNEISFRHHFDAIGKSKAYELGLVYPQGNEASMPSLLPDMTNVHNVLDMCAAPGGKSINILNRMNDDAVLISNEYSFQRVSALANNLERMGYENVVITNKDTEVLADELEYSQDLVILDAPCSGEGMVRKYPEIFNTYSNENINELASLQSKLLENAYRCLKPNGQLLYSTCTFSFKEDENQIESFLLRHPDMSRVSDYHKLSFIDDTEGQFYVLLKKDKTGETRNLKPKKTANNKTVEAFIKENLNIDSYYLYMNGDNFYLSLIPLPDLGYNVIRYGLYIGSLTKGRFEPEHNLYRSNRIEFINTYELDEKEYEIIVSGNEMPIQYKDSYVQLLYKGFPIGFGKAAKGRLKNRYPKGLRRML